jgi:hypothetical protein
MRELERRKRCSEQLKERQAQISLSAIDFLAMLYNSGSLLTFNKLGVSNSFDFRNTLFPALRLEQRLIGRGVIATLSPLKQYNRTEQFWSAVKVDESYVDAAQRKTRTKRCGKINCIRPSQVRRKSIHGDCSQREKISMPVLRQGIRPDIVCYTDGHTAYKALDVSDI